jgi:hypothetical protein
MQEGVYGSQITLTWEVDVLNQCTFSEFVFQARAESGMNAVWVSPLGCDQLTNISSPRCTAVGLNCQTKYRFQVKVSCVDTRADSDFSLASNEYLIPTDGDCTRPSDPPQDLEVSEVTQSSVRLAWSAGHFMDDCDFLRWEVLAQAKTSADKIVPLGCLNLVNRDVLTCSPGGLISNTEYTFTVQTHCADTAASSNPSRPSDPVTTLMIPADSPTNVAGVVLSTSTIELSWDLHDMNDCSFRHWLVEKY